MCFPELALDVNECDVSPNPCNDNGLCIDGVATFYCVCKPGYEGETCLLGTSLIFMMMFYEY